MLSRNPDSISLSNLKDIDPANFNWFGETSRTALAGRCLLDALQYLRAIPSFSAQFREVTNAHTIRLVCQCLSDSDLQGGKFLKKMKPYVVGTCDQLREARKDSVPPYGEDFWDWAVVLQAFIEVHRHFPNAGGLNDAKINDELTSFYENVESKMDTGLTVPANKDKEWYGPATAAAAHQILGIYRDRFGGKVDDVIAKMRAQALVQIDAGEYGGRKVQPYQQAWHYGQVVAEFPVDATAQAKFITDFSYLDSTSGKADRVYALARVLQGAAKAADNRTVTAAIDELYKYEDLGRPLGQGLMGDKVKGSLNVLEALWPTLQPGQKTRIRVMVDTLMRAHLEANTVGIVVAIGNEMEAAKKVFTAAGARVSLEELGTTVLEHEDYHVVVCADKAIMGAQEATKKLIDKHKVQWLIMFGIAGSLAEFVEAPGTPPKLVGRGPDIGEVVIATSLAPYGIYQKIRENIEIAKVPFRGNAWWIIPTDPVLFGLAHEVAESFGTGFCEGLIVTGTSVVDLVTAKAEVLKEFPGGLAAETEGYTVGLICLLSGVRYLVIRGISDPADGSKRDQARDKKREKKEQMQAAVAAGKVVAGVVKLLSGRW